MNAPLAGTSAASFLARYDGLAERRIALDKWAEHVAATSKAQVEKRAGNSP